MPNQEYECYHHHCCRSDFASSLPRCIDIGSKTHLEITHWPIYFLAFWPTGPLMTLSFLLLAHWQGVPGLVQFVEENFVGCLGDLDCPMLGAVAVGWHMD